MNPQPTREQLLADLDEAERELGELHRRRNHEDPRDFRTYESVLLTWMVSLEWSLDFNRITDDLVARVRELQALAEKLLDPPTRGTPEEHRLSTLRTLDALRGEALELLDVMLRYLHRAGLRHRALPGDGADAPAACCGASLGGGAVCYNPFNRVVQCHRCGVVWTATRRVPGGPGGSPSRGS